MKKENLDYIESHEERYIATFRIFTNCLLSDDTILSFNDKNFVPILKKIIQ